MQVHHIDGNPGNNEPANLITLCVEHHSEVSTLGGFGRTWNPSLLRLYKEKHAARIKRIRQQHSRLEGIVGKANLQTSGAERADFNLGAVYEDSFTEFFEYCTQLERCLRATTYRELRGLWARARGRRYLASNIGLLEAGKEVKRIFFVDYSDHPASYLPTIKEALKHEGLGVKTRIFLKDSFGETYRLPWDMFGVHDDKYLSVYRVENEAIFGGVVPFASRALEAAEIYDDCFEHASRSLRFCEEHRVYPSPKDITAIEAEVEKVKQEFRKGATETDSAGG